MITTGVRALLAFGLKSILSSFAAPAGRSTGWCVADVERAALDIIRGRYGRSALLAEGREMLCLLLPLRAHVDLLLWWFDGPVGLGMEDTSSTSENTSGGGGFHDRNSSDA